MKNWVWANLNSASKVGTRTQNSPPPLHPTATENTGIWVLGRFGLSIKGCDQNPSPIHPLWVFGRFEVIIKSWDQNPPLQANPRQSQYGPIADTSANGGHNYFELYGCNHSHLSFTSVYSSVWRSRSSVNVRNIITLKPIPTKTIIADVKLNCSLLQKPFRVLSKKKIVEIG